MEPLAHVRKRTACTKGIELGKDQTLGNGVKARLALL